MRVIKSIVIAIALLGLSACGGGGGGGSSNGGSSGSSSSSGGTACTSVSAGDTTLPEASITFPWRVSRTDGNTVVVRGTAQDASGIQSVVVNGVAANISCSSNTAGSKHRPAAIAANDGASWEAVITLPKHSTTDIVVEVTDGAGNVNESADRAQITNRRVPATFVYDSLNYRLFGAFEPSFGYLDILTGEVILAPLTGTDGLDALAPAGFFNGAVLVGNILYTAEAPYAGSSEMTIYSTDVNSGSISEFRQIDLELPEDTYASVYDLAYDDGRLYFLISFSDNTDDSSQIHIFQYNLGDSEFSLLSSSENTAQGEPLDSLEMASGNGELLVPLAGEFGGGDRIVNVNLTDGMRSPVSDVTGVDVMELVYDHVADITYAVGFGGVAAVDMNSETDTNISPETDQDFFNFSQVQSAALDRPGNRLLVGDESLDMILSIDIATGTRSKLFGNGVGEGHPLIAPRDFVIDAENNRVYVADDGGNAPEAIFAIDLETGNRTQISDIDQGLNAGLGDIALDSQRNRLLVSLEDEILAVDLDTETVSTFSGGDPLTGSGDVVFESITGMALDPGGQRLLVTDALADALIEVDLETGDRTVLSQAGTKGEGDPLDAPSGITVDLENNAAYVASQFLASIFRIDLETGDRTVILTECKNSGGTNWLTDTGLHNLAFNADTGDLWMHSEKMLRYNVNDGACVALGSHVNVYLDMALTEEGQLLATMFNQLVQFDTMTGNFVTISK